MANYDIIGNIAVVKFNRKEKQKEKKKFALDFLEKNKSVRTVLEKSEKIKGRLRTGKTKWIAGEKTKEALYKENGCVFRLNVDSCYFSPRLASDRFEIASKVKKGEKVLVMFSGIGIYGIVIARNSRAGEVVMVELGREPSRYALENVKRNKLGNVSVVQGDVCRQVPKLKEKFDRIIMPRPNLKESFFGIAFGKIKKNGMIHYYDFYLESEKEKMLEKIKQESGKFRKKIRILKVKKAGEIGIKRYRWRVDFKVFN